MSGPKCPKPARLRELLTNLYIEVGGEPDNDLDARWKAETIEVIDALEWLTIQLENRTLYHKKQAVKKKIMFALAKEAGLDGQAEKLTNDAMFNHVASQPEPLTSEEIISELGKMDIKKLQEEITNERRGEEDQD